MVYRIYVEKREGFSSEAKALLEELRGSGVKGLTGLRIVLRYDVEGVGAEGGSKSLHGVCFIQGVDDRDAFESKSRWLNRG